MLFTILIMIPAIPPSPSSSDRDARDALEMPWQTPSLVIITQVLIITIILTRVITMINKIVMVLVAPQVLDISVEAVDSGRQVTEDLVNYT